MLRVPEMERSTVCEGGHCSCSPERGEEGPEICLELWKEQQQDIYLAFILRAMWTIKLF